MALRAANEGASRPRRRLTPIRWALCSFGPDPRAFWATTVGLLARDRSDELFLWQPILDLVVAGRTAGHQCPHCKEAELEVRADEFEVRLRCPKCGEGFYGMLA